MFATRLIFRARPAFATATRSLSSTTGTFTLPRKIHRGASKSQNTFHAPRQRVDWQKTWQRRGYARYQRFQSSQGMLRAWAANPYFYYQVAGIGAVAGGVYIYNLETVPVSGRRRFNIVSPEYEAAQGRSMYEQTMQEFGARILPRYSKEHRMVQRVLDRLVPHSGLQDDKWEIAVIDDDMKNAFVIPGGKVFVFRGILDVCQGDDGLAAVLGHEIAHNVAHHAAERMSQSAVAINLLRLLYLLGVQDFGIGSLLNQLVFTLPGSRSQEEEADYIGLFMMAESCYDPSAAVALWARMEKDEQAAPPQFLSTHPSSHNRLEKIRGWLPQAQTKWEDGDCGVVGGFANDFRRLTNLPRW